MSQRAYFALLLAATLASPAPVYQGAVAPAYIGADEPSDYKKIATADNLGWYVAENVALSSNPSQRLIYLFPDQTGTVTLFGKGASFIDFYCPTGPDQAKGTVILNINGGADIVLDQRIANPNADGRSWAYHTEQLDPTKEYVIQLTYLPQAGVYPVFDGVRWR